MTNPPTELVRTPDEAREDLEGLKQGLESYERGTRGLLLLATAILGLVLPQLVSAHAAACRYPVGKAGWWLVATIASALVANGAMGYFIGKIRTEVTHRIRLVERGNDVPAPNFYTPARVLLIWTIAVAAGSASISVGASLWYTSSSVVCIAWSAE